YFFIAPIPVPFYIGADVKGSFTVARDFKIIINQGDPLKTMRQQGTDTPVDASEEFSMAASLGVSVTAGFGIDGIAGVWAEGGVTALPAITIAKQSRPDKPYPHYEFKLNFYLKAGVRIIFVSYEMTPISYNYVIADNHDPEKKPYCKKISGPWMPAPSANDVSGGTVTELAQAELESICIGSIDLDNSVYGDSWDGSDPGALGMQKVTLNADHLATLNGLVEENLPPYQNDAIPYDDQQSDEVWTAGTSDGLGVVTPDYHVKVLENAYANPKIKYMEVGGIRYMFFVAAIWVDHVVCPTLLCAELEYSTNKVDANRLYAVTYGTENKQSPRYVTDFDVSGAQVTEGEGSSEKKFNQFEVVVAYSKVLKQVDEKGNNLVEGQMGLFVRPFRWTGEAAGPQYLPQRKELKHGFSYDYKVKSLSIHIAPAVSQKPDQRKEYWTSYQVCVAYLLQYDYNYKNRLVSMPTVMMYTRNYNGESWSSDDDAKVESLNYPVSQVFVGTGYGFFPPGDYNELWNTIWRVAYVYNEDRKIDSVAADKIQNYFYRLDFWKGNTFEYTGRKATYSGYNMQRVLDHAMVYVGQDGMMRLTQHYNQEDTYNTNFTVPLEGQSFFEVAQDRTSLNFFYYWTESVKTPKDGTPAPVPTPRSDYKCLMGRMVSMEMKKDWAQDVVTGKYRTSQPFILCRLDQNVEQLSAYPVPGSYCGLYYTTVDAKKNAADIHFARVPIVDAIEVPSLTPSDPCIAQGEPFRMYINIENSGNTYLGRGTVELVYSRQGNTNTQRGTIDLLDCEKMMATPQEFDYSELGDDETYLMEEELTLAQAMKNADTAPYFDVSTFADSSDAGYQADQVKLKTFVPGERHLYYMDGCVIPRDWTGTVKITGNGVGAERRPIWQSAYAQYDDSALVTLTAGDIAAGSKKLDDSLGGGYMAYTKGASALAGYSDVVLEGRLMRLDGTDYLELCLRNESTDPCDVKLQIYGDSTLLLEKTFHSVACGAVFNTDNATGLLLDSMTPYDNGAVTEGYDPATSTAKNGYINLTFPVAALTQGETFYKLTAKLAAADGFATLESDEGDGQDFILMQGGFLRLTAQPDDLTLMTGTLGSLYASFADGIAPYTVNWQKLDADGGWHDVSELAVKSAAGMTQKNLWEQLLTSAVAETGSIAVSLPFRAVTKADEGSYRVVVTDKTGQWVASDWAALTVTDLIVPPKTGDAFPIGLALALLGLSLAGAAALVITRRRSMKTGGHS
ncbi:MAG: hypothetical protein PHY12_07945, partial [Eubacteriales bacterium]|nr:hypothetical protein [Eubacteriales bacterium]